MFKSYTLLACLLFVFNSLAYSQMDHAAGEILIQFTADSSPREVIAKYGFNRNGTPTVTLGDLLSEPMNIYRLHFNPEMIDENTLLRKLKSDRQISNVQFNHYVYPRETIPNDPNFSQQWHHVNNGNNGIADADIDSDLAWDITTGGLTALGDTIVVCVIEGGNLLHTDLIDNAWFNYNEIPGNGIDDDGNGYIDDFRGWNVQSQSDNGVYNGNHGTGVMGMIGAKGNNENGTVGANWDIKIMSVAGHDLSDEAAMIQAYTYPLIQRKLYNQSEGENGSFVVATNASWGIDNGNPEAVPLWAAFYDTLGLHGILNCGATSNSNVNVDVVGDIPTAIDSDYMISVTATNSSDVRTFSGFGATTIDLGAPGENVRTASGQSGTNSTSGTSFASPLTAGVIGLLYSVPCSDFAQFVKDHPQLAADYVRHVLLGGVDPVENLALETVTGGRLNAFNSLTMMLEDCEETFCLPAFSLNSAIANNTEISLTWPMTETQIASLRFRVLGTEEWTYSDVLDTAYFAIDTLSLCTIYEFEIGTSCTESIDDITYTTNTLVETAGCCVAPLDAVAAEATISSIIVAWTPGFNISGYEIFYRELDSLSWIFSGTASDGLFEIQNLDSCVQYEILIKPDCIDGFDVGATVIDLTLGCGICIDLPYCTTFGESSNDEYIQSVVVGDYINQSGNNGGYELFEETGLELNLGEEYEATLTPGFSFFPFPENFKLWIDLDQNGEFTDDEVLLESQNPSSSALTGTISIPEEAVLGATRMRITMIYAGNNDDPVDCGTFPYGETEDYCITIVNTTSVADEIEFSAFEIFPNPSKKSFYLNFEPLLENPASGYRVEIVDLTGKLVYQSAVNRGENRINHELNAGMYMVQLQNAQGQLLKSEKLVVTQ